MNQLEVILITCHGLEQSIHFKSRKIPLQYCVNWFIVTPYYSSWLEMVIKKFCLIFLMSISMTGSETSHSTSIFGFVPVFRRCKRVMTDGYFYRCSPPSSMLNAGCRWESNHWACSSPFRSYDLIQPAFWYFSNATTMTVSIRITVSCETGYFREREITVKSRNNCETSLTFSS